MKLVIASLAGSVGKTTITAHMLCPRMPNARVLAVDTANNTVKHFGIEAEEYSGEDFAQLYKQLVRLDDAIIDVGGSKEGKEFLAEMDWMDGHDEIDAFLIPAMPEDKDQKAAFKTIELLIAQGVSKDKIKVIFNGVEKNTVAEFDYLLGALSANGIPFSIDATIFRKDLFYNTLAVQKRSLASILDDETDYKTLYRQTPADDEDAVSKYSDLLYAQKTAPKINENLDTVFSALFPKTTKKAKG